MAQDRVNVETVPHVDGKREGIISDSVGKEIDIRTDVNQESSNPFHVKSLKKDPEREKFNDFLK